MDPSRRAWLPRQLRHRAWRGRRHPRRLLRLDGERRRAGRRSLVLVHPRLDAHHLSRPQPAWRGAGRSPAHAPARTAACLAGAAACARTIARGGGARRAGAGGGARTRRRPRRGRHPLGRGGAGAAREAARANRARPCEQGGERRSALPDDSARALPCAWRPLPGVLCGNRVRHGLGAAPRRGGSRNARPPRAGLRAAHRRGWRGARAQPPRSPRLPQPPAREPRDLRRRRLDQHRRPRRASTARAGCGSSGARRRRSSPRTGTTCTRR